MRQAEGYYYACSIISSITIEDIKEPSSAITAPLGSEEDFKKAVAAIEKVNISLQHASQRRSFLQFTIDA